MFNWDNLDKLDKLFVVWAFLFQVVLIVHFVPEGRSLCIEHHGDMFRIFFIQQTLEHIGHTEQSSCRITLAVGEIG